METVGIDVSASPARTVACRIEWRDGAAHVELPIRGIDDDTLLQLVLQPRACGIDAPFGWPNLFVETLAAHRAFAPLPVTDTTKLTLRATDRWVYGEVGWTPLSVSTDRIGRTALRVARVLAGVSHTWPANYRAGVLGGVVEVYPAAALSRWVTHRYRYKGRTNGASELAALSAELLTRPWLRFESEQCRRQYLTDGDNLDALIASFVARTHAKGLCHEIPSEHQREAEVEGWIALPKAGTLDLLPLESP